MDCGTLAEGGSMNRSDVATLLPSSVSAQLIMELKKSEMNTPEKNFVEVDVPNPPEKRESKKNIFLKKIGWKKEKAEKVVQRDKANIKTTEKPEGKEIENHGKQVPSIRKDEMGAAVPQKNVDCSTSKDGAKDNLRSESDKNMKNVKKKLWPKKLRLKQESSSKKAQKEVDPGLKREIGIKRKGNDVEAGSFVSSSGSKDKDPMQNVHSSSNVEYSMHALVPENTKNEKEKRRSFMNKLQLMRKTDYKKAEKRSSLRITLKRGSTEAEDGHSNDNGSVARAKNGEHSRKLESAMNELIPLPPLNKKSKKRSWLITLRIKTRKSSWKAEKEQNPISASQIERKQMGNDAEVSLSISSNGSGHVASRRDVETSDVELQNDTMILVPLNEQEFVERIFACLKESDFREGAIGSEGLRKARRIKRKGFGGKKVEIVRTLPPVLIPYMRSVQGSNREIKDIQSSPSILGLQKERGWSDHRSLWICPQLQNFLYKHTAPEEWFSVDFSAFCDVFVRILLSVHNSNEGRYILSTIYQGQSNSGNCQAPVIYALGPLIYGLWNMLHVLVHQKGSGRVDSTGQHRTDSLLHDTLRTTHKCQKIFVSTKSCVASIMWNEEKREIFAKEQTEVAITHFLSEPSLSILQNVFGGIEPLKPSKYAKVGIPAASTTRSVAITSSATVEIQEMCNFSQISDTTPSKSAPAGQKTIENLLLNAYVDYLEKQVSLLMESVNGLKREQENMKLTNDELLEENRKLRILLQGRLGCDGAKGINFKEESAIDSPQPKSRSRISIVKEATMGERACASSTEIQKEKYGQKSKPRCHTETVKTKNTCSNDERNEKLRHKKKWPDIVGATSAEGVKRNSGFQNTFGGAISQAKPLRDIPCTERKVFLSAEENSPSDETISDDRRMETKNDVEQMISKDLAFLNKNLDVNIAPVLTKIKIYYTLFAKPKKENDSIKPQKTTLRSELEIFKKHSEYMTELCDIIQVLLQDSHPCEMPGHSLNRSSRKETGQSCENFLFMCKNRVREHDYNLGINEDIGMVSSKRRSIQGTSDGRSTGNGQCKEVFGKSSPTNDVKKSDIDSGASSKSHTTTKKKTRRRRKNAHSDKYEKAVPLTENGTLERKKTYPTRTFRSNQKTPCSEPSKRFLN